MSVLGQILSPSVENGTLKPCEFEQNSSLNAGSAVLNRTQPKRDVAIVT